MKMNFKDLLKENELRFKEDEKKLKADVKSKKITLDDFAVMGFKPVKMEITPAGEMAPQIEVFYEYENKPRGTDIFRTSKAVKSKGFVPTASFGLGKAQQWLVSFKLK